MTGSRRLGPTPSPAAGPASRRRADRLLARDRGFVFHPCGLRRTQSSRARRKKTGPSPEDRRNNGSKHHLAVDADGVPLAAILTGTNPHDVTQLISLIEAVSIL